MLLNRIVEQHFNLFLRYRWRRTRQATAERRSRLGLVTLLIPLLIHVQCVQPTAEVLYAVPSWDDPDPDDGDDITPLSTGDADKAGGHSALPRLGPSGSRRSSDILCHDQSPSLADVIAPAPPVAQSHTSSRYVRSSCWSQFDLDPNGSALVRVPTAFTKVHAINPCLEQRSRVRGPPSTSPP